MENIGDNQYFQYRAYLSTEDNSVTPVLHWVVIYDAAIPSLKVIQAPPSSLPGEGGQEEESGEGEGGQEGGQEGGPGPGSEQEDVPDQPGENENQQEFENQSGQVSQPETENSPVVDEASLLKPTISFPPEDTKFPSPPTLRWNPVDDSSGVSYELIADNDPSLSSPELHEVVSGTVFDLSSLNLSPDTYYWRIRAVDETSNASEWSELKSFTISASKEGSSGWRRLASPWIFAAFLTGLGALLAVVIKLKKIKLRKRTGSGSRATPLD